MNVAILGSGFMGGTHARAFAKLPDVKVIGVSSRRLDKAEKLAIEVGATPTTDDMALVTDPGVDAISITLPTHLHKKYTVAALKAGKHVLLEKPFGLTVAECDAMSAAAKRSRKTLMVAHVLRFWPEYVALYEFVKSGKIGRPMSAMAQRLSVAPGWSDWFRDPKMSGGAVLDLIVHDFDLVNWLFGRPKAVYARGKRSKSGTWDNIHAMIDFGAGHAFIEGSEMLPADYPFTMTLKVLCERGVVDFQFRAGGVSVEMGGGGSFLVAHEPGKASKLEPMPGDGYEAEVAYFVSCVRQGRKPKYGSPEQARAAVALSNAAAKSLQTGRIVKMAAKKATANELQSLGVQP